jgi:hypothetical protein
MVEQVSSTNDAPRRGTNISAYPINGSELSRRLLGRDVTPDDYAFVQGEVRAALQQFECPRESGSFRPPYRVDESMARRVAAALGRKLR